MQQEDFGKWEQDTEEIPKATHQIVDVDFSSLLMFHLLMSGLCDLSYSVPFIEAITISSLPSLLSLLSLLSACHVCTAASPACLPLLYSVC